jgi:hypothetical protein
VSRQPEALLEAPMEAVRARLRAQMLIDDPVAYAHETLGVWLWSKQQEVILALEDHAKVAVRSCHDSGKSFTAAVIAARWLDTHPVGQARVITTAPTNTQVRGILWVEINQLHERAHLPGRVNQTEWWIGSYMAGIGRKPADYRPEAFQGLHARWPLIIVDEAGGVNAALIDAAETLATNVNAKMLLIGNPDDPQSPFADIHNNPDKHGYHIIKISAWDTPNFTEEGPQLLANPDPSAQLLPEVLLSPAWVEGRRKAWGMDHPFWMAKVEAEFPSQDSSAICRIADLIKARVPVSERAGTLLDGQPDDDTVATQLLGIGLATIRGVASAHGDGEGGTGGPPSLMPPSPVPSLYRSWPNTLGVDVAGSEQGDETVARLVVESPMLTGRPNLPGHVLAVGDNGDKATKSGHLAPTTEWRTRSSDPAKVADFIVSCIIQANAKVVNIDSIGVGFGIIGMVRERLSALGLSKGGQRVVVHGINGAARANDPVSYGNLRGELWWTVGRLLFQRGVIDTSNADNLEELEAQLLVPRYKIVKGKIYAESKDDIKSRLGRSPDYADAFVYALARTVSRAAGVATISGPPSVAIDPRSMAGQAVGNTASTKMIHTGHQRLGVSSPTPGGPLVPAISRVVRGR